MRNSWGTDWGNDGYFYLSYDDATVVYNGVYLLEDEDNYTGIYQYDTNGWGSSLAMDDFVDDSKASKVGYMSNIFTTGEEEELLEAVSFYTTDINSSYEISVYTGVSEDSPVSGTLVFSGQTGTELYSGYHTIELTQAVKLEENQSFSVVVKLTNPEHPYTIPVELSFLSYNKEEPEYCGNGHESFVSADGINWEDAASGEFITYYSDGFLYTSNVCLKAFTNPVLNDSTAGKVQFSVLQGQIADGTLLTLTGSSEIYYSVNDAEAVKYTSPITLTGDMEITAWGVKDGKKGVERTRTYTKAASQLVELSIGAAGNKTVMSTSSGDNTTVGERDFTYITSNDSVQIYTMGQGSIEVDKEAVDSNTWSEPIELEDGDTVITITTSEDNKTATTYTITVHKNVVAYDYVDETIAGIAPGFTVKDADNNELTVGSSIKPYITVAGEDEPVALTVTAAGGGEAIEYVPQRNATIVSEIILRTSRLWSSMAHGML